MVCLNPSWKAAVFGWLGHTRGFWRRGPILLSLALSASGIAQAHILAASPEACGWLAHETQRPTASEHRVFAEAQRQSGITAPVYLDPSKAILRVAHIPYAPYLTAIAGRRQQCVAVSPAWLRPLRSPHEQRWLVEVALAGLRHRHTYRLMVRAAEHPPTGLFSGLATWWGRHKADRAILASERQAARWVGTNRSYALAALKQLAQLPSFRGQKWLPSIPAQEQVVRKALG